jgi:hypothetical protein
MKFFVEIRFCGTVTHKVMEASSKEVLLKKLNMMKEKYRKSQEVSTFSFEIVKQ